MFLLGIIRIYFIYNSIKIKKIYKFFNIIQYKDSLKDLVNK